MDGTLDLVLSDYGGNAVDVMRGDGGGGFGPLVHTVAAVNPEDFAVGRFNADAYPDVVLGSTYFGMAYFGIVLNCFAIGIEETSTHAPLLFPVPADDRIILTWPNAPANCMVRMNRCPRT